MNLSKNLITFVVSWEAWGFKLCRYFSTASPLRHNFLLASARRSFGSLRFGVPVDRTNTQRKARIEYSALGVRVVARRKDVELEKFGRQRPIPYYLAEHAYVWSEQGYEFWNYQHIMPWTIACISYFYIGESSVYLRRRCCLLRQIWRCDICLPHVWVNAVRKVIEVLLSSDAIFFARNNNILFSTLNSNASCIERIKF